VLGPSEGGLGGQDVPDGFPASGRNAYPSGANTFFADASCLSDDKKTVYHVDKFQFLLKKEEL